MIDQVSNYLMNEVEDFFVESVEMLNDVWKDFYHLRLSLLLVNVRSVKDLERFDDLKMQLAMLEIEDSCSELTELKRRTRRQFYDRNLGKNVSVKTKWRNLNRILGRKQRKPIDAIMTNDGATVTDPCVIAEQFNDFFAKIPLEIAPLARPGDDVRSLGTLTTQDRSFFLEPVTNEEVMLIVMKLSDDKSPGFDNIPPRALKTAAGTIVPLLVDLINESFRSGIVPDKFKIARVTPVFKAGDRSCVSNYRPISVLTVFDKVFETCLYTRLVHFFKSTDFFHVTQYGFREKSGTTGACIELVDDILEAVDEKRIVCSTFFDSSKAFDLVPHDLLLMKLELSGIRGHPLDLISSYLTNRNQFVSLNGCTSSMRQMTLGVAQGSKLGPLMYLVYTNDLGDLPLEGKVMMYADDVAILYRCVSKEALMFQLHHDMDLVSAYFRVNRLVLNVSKSKIMYFGARSLRVASDDLVFDGCVIERVSEFRYLGLVLDSKLSFRRHVDSVAKKVSCVIGMLYRVRDVVPRHTLINLYFSLIHSNLLYLLEVYGCAGKLALFRLEKLHRKALKTILNLPRRYPTLELYERVRSFNIYPIKLN